MDLNLTILICLVGVLWCFLMMLPHLAILHGYTKSYSNDKEEIKVHKERYILKWTFIWVLVFLTVGMVLNFVLDRK